MFQKWELFEINRFIQIKKFAKDIINAGRNEILGKAKIIMGTRKIIIWKSNGNLIGLSHKIAKE